MPLGGLPARTPDFLSILCQLHSGDSVDHHLAKNHCAIPRALIMASEVLYTMDPNVCTCTKAACIKLLEHNYPPLVAASSRAHFGVSHTDLEPTT